MGMTLPGELVSVLATLGFSWPESDEEALLALGRRWVDFGAKLPRPLDEADHHARQVWLDNQGAGIDAFRDFWRGPDAPKRNLDDGAVGATVIGAGLLVCAGVVAALKVNVVVQATLFAIEVVEALATAVATMGASLAEIPIFRAITKLILNELLDLAIDAVLNG